MKIYLVGGAVRDQLLGLQVKERDWVVVGATVAEMLRLGYKQVGKEFPVFLHPETREEYALARMERKVKPGYSGFTFDTSPQVTLQEDLQRRDLTINAIAQTETGELIDPFHGAADINKHILRHVSQAFAEDPVRILRVGRFLARYAHLGFTVAPETIELMRNMVHQGEVNALVAERVWKELERALSEPQPEKFFQVLADCGALAILFPQLNMQSEGMQALQRAASVTADSRIRLAVLLHHLDDARKNILGICQRYRLPTDYKQLALLTAAHYQTAFTQLNARQLVNFFAALDIYRREQRFQDFLLACTIIADIHGVPFQADRLQAAAQVAKSANVQILIQQGYTGMTLATELAKMREQLLTEWLSNQNIEH